MKYIASLAVFSLGIITALASPLNKSAHVSLSNDSSISEVGRAQLIERARELLRTASFNSGTNSSIKMDISKKEIREEYDRVLEEKHLVVTFSVPFTETTQGGPVQVFQIIIGLNNPDHIMVDSLFTLDAKRRVTKHMKYSGMVCIDLAAEVYKESHRSSDR